MKLLRLFTFVSFLAVAPAAFGQYGELAVSGGKESISNGDIGDYNGAQATLSGNWNLVFRGTLNQGSWFGHEFGYGYHRVNFSLGDGQSAGTATHIGFYDFLLYATPEGSRVRPFVTGGGHFANFIFPGGSVNYGGSTKFGLNYGGGIKVRVTGPWGFRLDYRQYSQPKPFGFPNQNGWIRLQEISGGFSFMY